MEFLLDVKPQMAISKGHCSVTGILISVVPVQDEFKIVFTCGGQDYETCLLNKEELRGVWVVLSRAMQLFKEEIAPQGSRELIKYYCNDTQLKISLMVFTGREECRLMLFNPQTEINETFSLKRSELKVLWVILSSEF